MNTIRLFSMMALVAINAPGYALPGTPKPALPSNFYPDGHQLSDTRNPARHMRSENYRRATAFRGTMYATRDGYNLGGGNKEPFDFPPSTLKVDSAQRGTQRYSEDDLSRIPPAAPQTTCIEFLNTDTLAAAEMLVQAGYSPAVLNFASEMHGKRGGGVRNGRGAQEESIMSRSSAMWALNTTEHQKALYSSGIDFVYDLIYTPDVAVVKDRDHRLIPPFFISLISSAALNISASGPLAGMNPESVTYKDATVRKIRMQLRSALRHRHESIVLGAFGGGVYAGDDKDRTNKVVAELYNTALNESEFAGQFRKVTFAIMGRDTTTLDIYRRTIQLKQVAAIPPHTSMTSSALESSPSARASLSTTQLVDFRKALTLSAKEGLSGVTPTGTWSVGNRVRLILPRMLPDNFTLMLTAAAYGPNAGQDLKVVIGETTKCFRLGTSFDTVSLPFATDGTEDTIEFFVPEATSPAELGRGNDNRKLGIRFKELSMKS